MKVKAIHIYVVAMTVLALAILPFLGWSEFFVLGWRHWIGVASLILIGIASESLAISLQVSKNAGQSSITFIPLLVCFLLFGPAATVLLMLVTGSIAEFGIRKKPLMRGVFNISQWVVSISVASVGFDAVAHLLIQEGPATLTQQIPAFFAFALIFLEMNQGSVALAIAVSEGVGFSKVWRQLVGRGGSNFIYDLLVSPLAVGVAYLYQPLWIFGFVLSFLPLLFIRHAYLTYLKLQEVNRDLLRALVKAIETRDPYTSGHSQRVAMLAARIAREMALPAKRLEEVEMAALLHDIGKIDAIYTEILKKPDALSAEERAIIESHVTKGVELLRSLSSVPAEVIAAVRHHHERHDGGGYPDGISGDQIPLASRIIKVCDAVDAMLSDRPYRRALALSVVREQLLSCSGTQFDPEVARYAARGALLEEHVEVVAKSRVASAPASSPPARGNVAAFARRASRLTP